MVISYGDKTSVNSAVSTSAADPEIVGGGCGRVAEGREGCRDPLPTGDLWRGLCPSPEFFPFWTSKCQFLCVGG